MACAPVAGHTMTNAVSHNCGFADTTNTGVPAGTSLVGVPGDITAPKADGSTGQGWSWNGSWVTVAAGGALKNVRVAGRVNLAGDGATVEDSDITTSGANQFGVAAIGGNNMVVDHNTIHGSAASVGKACDNGVRDVYGNSENLTITRQQHLLVRQSAKQHPQRRTGPTELHSRPRASRFWRPRERDTV